jgi:hypothetical protein
VVTGLAFDAIVWWQGFTQEDGMFSPENSSQPYRDALWLLVLFVPYAWVLWAHHHGAAYRKRTVWTVFAVVAAPLVLASPIQSHDVFQYLVYGHMQVSHGLNPYVFAPDALPGDPWVAWASWQHAPSVYGPGWTLLVAGLVMLAGPHPVGSLLLVKVMTLACVVLAGLGLTRLRSGWRDGLVGDPVGHLIGFALNPLVLTAGILGAHADVALAACFAWAMVYDQRRRPVVALVLLGVACLVKAYAVIALVAYVVVLWRRGERRRLGAGLGVVAALAVVTSWPYWQGLATLKPLLSTGDHASASLAGFVQEADAWLLARLGVDHASVIADASVRIVSVVGLAALAFWVLVRAPARRQPWWAASLLLGAFFVVSPWFLPWYLLGLLVLVLPLAHPPVRRAVIVATASMVVVLPLAGDLVQTVVRYLPPVVAARWRPRVAGPAGMTPSKPPNP